MSDEIIGPLGFGPSMRKRRSQRRRSTVFAELIATVALVISIAVVATVVTVGICCAEPTKITRSDSQR
jgi:hypothetical protein